MASSKEETSDGAAGKEDIHATKGAVSTPWSPMHSFRTSGVLNKEVRLEVKESEVIEEEVDEGEDGKEDGKDGRSEKVDSNPPAGGDDKQWWKNFVKLRAQYDHVRAWMKETSYTPHTMNQLGKEPIPLALAVQELVKSGQDLTATLTTSWRTREIIAFVSSPEKLWNRQTNCLTPIASQSAIAGPT